MRAAIKRALLGGGHYRRRLARNAFPGVAVLCYHGILPPAAGTAAALPGLHVGTDDFESHCRMLRSTCSPISLEQWLRADAGGDPLPPRPVLLTFDDGYRSVLTEALPALRRHRIPALVFACSGPIEHRRLFWFDRIARERGEAEVERLKSLPYGQWRREADPDRSEEAEPGDPDEPLTAAELMRLADEPLIEIGGHTRWHPVLSRAEAAEQRREIDEDRARLESLCGRAPRAFAFPNGRPGVDFDGATVELVGEAGYSAAFTTADRFCLPEEPPLERPRFLMLASVGAAELAHRLAYSWGREA